MKRSKHLSKKNNKKLSFICLLLLLVSIISVLSILKKREEDKNIQIEERYFKGEINTANYAANLLDKIDAKNVIYSPYNIKESLSLLYRVSENETKEEIKNYLKQDPTIETTSLEINTKYKVNKTYESLYLQYIEELKKEDYLNKSVNSLRELKSNEKEKLLILMNQINMSYDGMIGKQNYSVKSIKNYKITKEDEEKNANNLKSTLNKIADTYETYEIKKEIININYLYYNEDFYSKKEIDQTFIKKVEKETNQKIKSFSKENNNINEEIKVDTKEKIKYMIDDIDIETTKLLSLNTLYFNSNWEDNIEKKKIQYVEFENKEKETQIAEMMYDYVEEYYENEYAKAFKKHFEGKDYSFIGILPKQEKTTASTLDLDSLLKNKIEEKVLIGIPKFSIISEINCKHLLEEDINHLFSKEANLNKITASEMYVEVMKQKISLTIAEKGTVASEITNIDLETTAREKNTKEIVLNKPFYFLILNDKTEEIFFIGKLETLKND